MEYFSDVMYSRTQNENGSFNTRCLDCFMTIASCVETEKELREREAHHMCPEKALAELMRLERAAFANSCGLGCDAECELNRPERGRLTH